MKDPQRFIERGAGELERELVASMHDDAPPAAARARALAALGAGAALTATASATTAATLAAKAALPSVAALATKWLVVGAGVSLLAAGVAHQAGWSFGATGPRVPAHAARPATEHASPRRIVVPTRKAEPALSPTATSTFEGPQPLASSRPSTGARLQSVEIRSVPDVELAKEVRALDQVRQAALAHDPKRALRLVAAYQSAFPLGKLGPEATVLRIEALIASGNKPAAANLARGFLRSDPAGPLAERVRTLLGEATGP
jgi:hypothetical protein